MQDAFGGIVNIMLIALFLIIAEGILGLAVNYTKAFKMKNLVISSFEKYETAGCFDSSGSCYKAIAEGAKRIGYAPTTQLNCANMSTENVVYTGVEGMYCYAKLKSSSEDVHVNKKATYRIVTGVDINIPIVKQILSLDIFKVKGDTRLINIEANR